MPQYTPWPDNWPSTILKTAESSCTILHYGAHIVSCRLKDSQEIFWLSPQSEYILGNPIRGGNPLCWPNFGVNPDFPNLPKHGIARLLTWEKIQEKQDASQASAVFVLTSDAMQTFKIPAGISLKFTVTLTDKKLKTDFEVLNRSNAAFKFTQCQHAYFAVSHINNIALCGLQNSPYLDRLSDTRQLNTEKEFTIRKPSDLIFLAKEEKVTIVDSDRLYRIGQKTNAENIVVWNPYQAMPPEITDMGPDAFQNFVCVEPVNTQQTAVELVPGADSILTMEITPEK